MATRVRTAGRFANLVGSDSDSDLGGMESLPRKRQSSVTRGAASNRISKPSSKLAGSIDKKAPRRLSPGRPVLLDKSNLNATRPSYKSRDEKPSRATHDEVFEEDSMLKSHPSSESRKKQRLEDSRPVKQSFATTKRYVSSPQRAADRYPRKYAAEVEDDAEVDMVDVIEQEEEEVPRPASRPTTVAPVLSRARPISQPQKSQGDSSMLERCLREMTRKYENLEGRYTELREVGVAAAERNYEKLRKQADENAATASKLIAKLKEELAAQRQASGDTESLRRQLQDSQSNAQDLSDRVAELTNSLAESERQIKALNAKLAASRAAPGNAIPSSAVKGNAAKAWTGQSELVHAAHAKEDLYADLTGLIIQGVKQDGNQDIFDCIQTGRNGTLHFKLGVAGSSSTASYEESMVLYSPQLKADRDADLIGRLPKYLRDEIGFKRPQAANFYSKVVRALRERQSRGEE
ncbi:chromosome segregation protein [Cordyceps fumosorosea ARSEF 2679]|uniref:Chromosome segregation protein n=1 Tax=Cordyceps fumosorosea (strain ARSEF 2679) TaxID=1081104 RepID=A0A162MRG2_CORFA|nr:chromosome segregation protein [Cordyceps fumosorosea ARSEF 2679]OAA69059.1 chromosome segregation protein [Cordyceps fumosorosea ARSEF 2679]